MCRLRRSIWTLWTRLQSTTFQSWAYCWCWWPPWPVWGPPALLTSSNSQPNANYRSVARVTSSSNIMHFCPSCSWYDKKKKKIKKKKLIVSIFGLFQMCSIDGLVRMSVAKDVTSWMSVVGQLLLGLPWLMVLLTPIALAACCFHHLPHSKVSQLQSNWA